MNKKILIVIIVVLALSIVGTVVYSMMAPKQNITSPRETGASIQEEISGHYAPADNMYYITGTVENTGEKEATNYKIAVTLFNAADDEEVKSETLEVGNIAPKSVKELNYSLSVPSGYVEVIGRWETTWDSQ